MKIANTICLTAVLAFLTACASLHYFSEFEFDFQEDDTGTKNEIVQLVTQAVMSRGGDCQLSTRNSERWVCSLDYFDVSTIYVGIDGIGKYTVRIRSVGSPIFPPTQISIRTEKYLPKGLKETEDWILQLLEPYKIKTAIRAHGKIRNEIDF